MCDQPISYSRLSGPVFSPSELCKRLAKMDVVTATRLSVENLRTALSIEPNKVREFFSLSPHTQRELLFNFFKLVWDFDERVLAAMKEVPREYFVQQRYKVIANWADTNVVRNTCTIESAWLIGYLLTKLAPKAGENALILGAGTGYSALLLSSIVGPSGSVTCVELDKQVYKTSIRNIHAVLKHDANIDVINENALSYSNRHINFDVVWPTMSCEELPSNWESFLSLNGRMVFFKAIEETNESLVEMYLYTKNEDRLLKSIIMTDLVNSRFLPVNQLSAKAFEKYQLLEEEFLVELNLNV